MTKGDDKFIPKIFEAVKRDTQFTRTEIEALYKIYCKLTKLNRLKKTDQDNAMYGGNLLAGKKLNQQGVDRTAFRELLHNTFDIVTDDMITERIFSVWDKTNSGLLALESWFMGLSIFLKGTVNDKINFCFAIYDLNSDGFITRDEMFQLLKTSLIKHPHEDDPDESVKELVEIVIRKFDKDKDGKVSISDYTKSVTEEPLLIEAFGNCLPSDRAIDTFMSVL